MRKAIIASALLPFLTAGQCSTTQPAVEVRTVQVPVAQPCLSKEQLASDPRFQEPPLVGDKLKRTPEGAAHDRDILGASALLLRAWGKELRVAHEGCAE